VAQELAEQWQRRSHDRRGAGGRRARARRHRLDGAGVGSNAGVAHAVSVLYLAVGIGRRRLVSGRSALVAARKIKEGSGDPQFCRQRSPPRASMPKACCRRLALARAVTSSGEATLAIAAEQLIQSR
jgi:hypothetical protein